MVVYLSFAGRRYDLLPVDVEIDGIDVSSLLLDGKALASRTLYWQDGKAKGAARLGQWKFMREGKGDRLYNLNDDLKESTDVASTNPEIFQTLKKQYESWLKEVTANPTGPELDPDFVAKK